MVEVEKFAAMDFFEHQDVARKKTTLLVVYYFLAVAFIMVAVYLVVAGTFLGVQAQQNSGKIDILKLWQPELFAWVIGGTLFIVLVGSSYKISQLRGGGRSVGELLGGRLVNRNSRDANERKVLNVVEEMAIASGTPVPPVYLLDQESGINAFAAGYTTGDAIIGVTRGCIEQLNRDELQGVIAHEFSHVFNGDMRLNIRLIGILHGILIIGLVGYFVFRFTLHSTGRSRSKEKGGAMAIAVMGLCIWIIGYVGVFFGKLIKSAISRQREYFADASAVQFTRNPDGIAGALKRIGGFKKGSRLATPNAEETSHFFFSNGLASAMFGMMATHPPLEERIKRIDPQFAGDFKEVARSRKAVASDAASGFAGVPAQYAVEPGSVTSSIGVVKPEHIEYATSLIAAIPERLINASREPYGARAVIYALLLNSENEPRSIQIRRLHQYSDPAVCEETMKLLPLVEALGCELRLPLADLAVSSLKELSKNQYLTFKENVDQLAEADQLIDLFEFALKQMIMRKLEPVFNRVAAPAVRYKNVGSVLSSCSEMLSCLAYWGAERVEDSEAAFLAGMERLGVEAGGKISPLNDCGLAMLSGALKKLAMSAPSVKKQLIEACTICIAVDGKVTVEEAELLRSIADSLDCPVPPFLPGQSV